MNEPLTDEDIKQKFQFAIDELAYKGTTSDEIAKALIEDGCQTDRLLPTCFCPVGKWICHRIPWAYDKGFIVNEEEIRQGWNFLMVIPLPEQISKFIKKLDRGDYKELYKPTINVPTIQEQIEINDQIDQWHDGTDPRKLHEFLGFTKEEYAIWVEGREDHGSFYKLCLSNTNLPD